MFKNLKAEMLKQDVSINKLAQHIGVTKDTMYRKLIGRINITIREAKKIQTLFPLNNSLEYLFEEDSCQKMI